MPLPSSLSQYDDVRAVLEAALDSQEAEAAAQRAAELEAEFGIKLDELDI